MNKSKIDWCDYTWNPVTGCLNGCEYCYARKIANRFSGYLPNENYDWKVDLLKNLMVLCGIQARKQKDGKIVPAPYPFGFDPTFHKYRLDEPQKLKKPSNIFVCSMADLFGDWTPESWIQEVFKACEKAPWHNYLFLTKNPKRYAEFAGVKILPIDENFWYGTTKTDTDDPYFWSKHHHTFISFEPLLSVPPRFLPRVDWVIVGQQTNPTVKPKDEWVQWIIDEYGIDNIPVFIKRPLYERFPIQEYPKELLKD